MIPTVFCKHLRTKSMYIPALAQAGADALQHAAPFAQSSHCWCNCTLTETGPDDKPVGPEHCKTGRQCFKDQ